MLYNLHTKKEYMIYIIYPHTSRGVRPLRGMVIIPLYKYDTGHYRDTCYIISKLNRYMVYIIYPHTSRGVRPLKGMVIIPLYIYMTLDTIGIHVI